MPQIAGGMGLPVRAAILSPSGGCEPVHPPGPRAFDSRFIAVSPAGVSARRPPFRRAEYLTKTKTAAGISPAAVFCLAAAERPCSFQFSRERICCLGRAPTALLATLPSFMTTRVGMLIT